MAGKFVKDIHNRFWSKVNKTNRCWIWKAQINTAGYGIFWFNGKNTRAHRYAFETVRKEIPMGLQLDHLCRNRACVNPYHLEPVTQSVNSSRGRGRLSAKLRTRKITCCPRGHMYDEKNTIIKRGARHCRECQRQRMIEYKIKKKEKINASL